MVAFLILLLFAVIFEGTCRAESLGGRCSRKRVARLMRKAALQGCIRGRKKRTPPVEISTPHPLPTS